MRSLFDNLDLEEMIKHSKRKQVIDEEDDLILEEVEIPKDVLNGKREQNLYWDKDDPRNTDTIMMMKER